MTPNPNPTDADIRAKIHVGEVTDPADWGNRIGIQDIPIAIEYPDWNNWLPDVHPFTSYGYNDFTGSELWTRLGELETRLDTPGEVATEANTYRNWFFCQVYTGTGCGNKGMLEPFERIDYAYENWPGKSLFDLPNTAGNQARFYLGTLGFVQLLSVKQWGVVNERHLQDMGDEFFGGRTVPAGKNGAGSPMQIGLTARTATACSVGRSRPAPSSTRPRTRTRRSGSPAWGPTGPLPADERVLLDGVVRRADDSSRRESPGVRIEQRGAQWTGATSSRSSTTRRTAPGSATTRGRTGSRSTCGRAPQRLRVPGRGGAGARRSAFRPRGGRWSGSASTSRRTRLDWTGRLDPDQAFVKHAAVLSNGAWLEWIASVPVAWWERGDPQANNRAFEPASYTPTAYPGSGYYYDAYTWADNAYRMPSHLLNWGASASPGERPRRVGREYVAERELGAVVLERARSSVRRASSADAGLDLRCPCRHHA